MAIIVYKSTDASAPSLSGQVGRLIAVLDACLVTGYGSKPAAGWTKSFSGTNLAAYRMATTGGATGMYLRVDDTGTTTSRVVGYETMSDVNTGTNVFPTTAQLSGGGWVWKSSTADAVARPWCLIADNTNSRSFYLIIEPDQTTFGTSGTFNNVTFFGDINTRKATDGYQCMLVAQTVTLTTNVSNFGTTNVTTYAATGGHFLARAWTGITVSVTCSKGRNYRATATSAVLGVGDSTVFPNRVTNSIDLARLMVQESAVVLRGLMPGIYEPQGGTVIANNYDEIAGQGTFTGTTFLFAPVRATTTAGSAFMQITGTWY